MQTDEKRCVYQRRAMIQLTDSHGQRIEFAIPEQYQRIGVRCSGGADSAILLYMLNDLLADRDVEINVITCSNDEKHRWNGRRAADVINYVVDRTNINRFNTHFSYYRPIQNPVLFDEFEVDLFERGMIDCVVSGVTALPEPGSTVQNSAGETVDLCSTGPEYRLNRNKPTWINAYYTPFVNVDKRFVAAMYRVYGADELLQLTRSCEELPSTGSYDPEFENQTCGNCWWCLERAWAFGE